MIEKTCRCGASKKRFNKDIGPFYVGECCETAGFDGLGKPMPGSTEKLTEFFNQKSSEPIDTVKTIKYSRSKLKDLLLLELKNIANSKGIEGSDSMTRKQLIEAILK